MSKIQWDSNLTFPMAIRLWETVTFTFLAFFQMKLIVGPGLRNRWMPGASTLKLLVAVTGPDQCHLSQALRL